MITFSQEQIIAWLSPLLWPFLRTLAIFTATPILSSRAFPVRARVAISFLIAVAAQPSLEGMPIIDINGPEAAGAVVQQVGVGLAIGFCIRLVFTVFEVAGELVGFQMGLNFASFFDPSMNSQTSAVARFFGQMATFMFIVTNGHLLLLLTVIQSFAVFPVDQHFLQAADQMRIYRLGALLFSSALWIALPMIGVMLFTNLALGFVSRVAPQMNIYAIGFPVTLTVGMVGIASTLPMFDQPFHNLLMRALEIFAVG
ncbi:flagellar biosynthetic protein FliR [Candidatus Symbiobacter mobilis]|uniref:Flagellar biosynthetic protein FliR n=1 Tax=Candidatus Symbiobacter mobilis CR TaxID=946483 RepID=U5NA01_9BURK|nr:flagellar biosynthetic protein FliR [Candidatus Symbiobacter mobilis]AGX88361.1 flagellar biosynthetic protein FliR [Candidatus Symbiobacter mobilis CR]